jgi:hypothetical protein
MDLDPFFNTSAEAEASSWWQYVLVAASLPFRTARSSLQKAERYCALRQTLRNRARFHSLFTGIRQACVGGCNCGSTSVGVTCKPLLQG